MIEERKLPPDISETFLPACHTKSMFPGFETKCEDINCSIKSCGFRELHHMVRK